MRCDICGKEYVGRPAYIPYNGKMVWSCPRCTKKFGIVRPWYKKEEVPANGITSTVKPPKPLETPIPPPAIPLTMQIENKTPSGRETYGQNERHISKGINFIRSKVAEVKENDNNFIAWQTSDVLLEEFKKMNQKLDTLIELINEL